MKRRRQNISALLAIAALSLSVACFAQRARQQQTTRKPTASASKKDKVKKMDQKIFKNVTLNTFQPTTCSPPQPDPSWRGVVIQAPAKVGFKRGKPFAEGAFARIPVCGVYRLNVPFPIVEDVIEIVAKDKKTGKVYSGIVSEVDDSPEELPPPAPPLTKEQVAGLASGRYFNPNLANFVELPHEPAVYEVHVKVRDARSNTVTIELVEGEVK